MTQTNWAIKGTLSFAPQHHEVEDSYGNPVPLAGVKVLVEAKEIAADPTWDNWGEDVTNADGGFRITNEKDRSPRMFRVRAMFKNDDLKIYPPNTGLLSQAIDKSPSHAVVDEPVETLIEQALAHATRLIYDVDWFTIHQDDKDHKHEAGRRRPRGHSRSNRAATVTSATGRPAATPRSGSCAAR